MYSNKKALSSRFRGLLPVVIDIEASGLNPDTCALLEIAAVMLEMNDQGQLIRGETYFYAVEPFTGACLDPEALAVTKIDPDNPLRFAVPAGHALNQIFSKVKQQVSKYNCQRAVLVGHNAWFDLVFIQAEAKRWQVDNNPFHSFTTLDTATLSAIYFAETVLAKALKKAKIPFDVNQAHSAIYDAEKTADLFCYLVNQQK